MKLLPVEPEIFFNTIYATWGGKIVTAARM